MRMYLYVAVTWCAAIPMRTRSVECRLVPCEMAHSDGVWCDRRRVEGMLLQAQ